MAQLVAEETAVTVELLTELTVYLHRLLPIRDKVDLVRLSPPVVHRVLGVPIVVQRMVVLVRLVLVEAEVAQHGVMVGMDLVAEVATTAVAAADQAATAAPVAEARVG